MCTLLWDCTATDIGLALDLFYGPVYHRLLKGHADITEDFIRGLVDTVDAGLNTATTAPARTCYPMGAGVAATSSASGSPSGSPSGSLSGSGCAPAGAWPAGTSISWTCSIGVLRMPTA